MLQTICKIGPVLDLFTPDCTDWGAAEVALELGIPRSSAHSLLASLATTGLLRMQGRGRYRIGWRVVELGAALCLGPDLRAVARPVMTDLARRLGETVHLAVLDRAGGLVVDRVAGSHPGSVTGLAVGARFPLHCCAAGKVLAALHPNGGDALRLPLRRLTPATVVDPAVLAAQLTRIGMSGWASDAGEAVTDIHSVAAAVRDVGSGLVVAMSVMAPASRFLPRVPLLKRGVQAAAGCLSQRLLDTGSAQIHQGSDSPVLSSKQKSPA